MVMPAIRYVYSLSGLELTFRLEFRADPAVRIVSLFGDPPDAPAQCQLTGAVCLAICEETAGLPRESRLASPAERLEWGAWLLERIDQSEDLRREIHALCLVEADACEPLRRRSRVSARWKRAA
jgi:hypothetical protein